MTKIQFLNTIEKLENTFSSLRNLVNDVYSERDKLSQDQEENVRVRHGIISSQKTVLLDMKKTKEEGEKIEKKRGALDVERADIDRMIVTSNEKKKEIEKEMEKLDEKMEVAKNLTAWTERLEDTEQVLKSGQARLASEKRDFDAEKTAVRLKGKENTDYEISLKRREKKLKAREGRVEKILGNV